MFTGCGTAMVTPFQANGSLDESTLRKLVRRQIEEGIDFLVPCGTTGESPTLSREEHLRVVGITVEEAKRCSRKVPVLAGAGGYCTKEVIELAEECQRAGADGILSVSPYYNKPNQEGLYQHFKAIAESVRVSVIVYNIFGRTSVNVETPTLMRLAEIANIVGVKEASGNIGQIGDVAQHMPASFALLAGDDSITIPLIALGGCGLISVVSNEIPGPMTELVRRANAGDFAGARALHRKFLPLMQVNFIEPNPTPAKWAMSRMGLMESVCRLPMVPPSDANKKKIEAVLEQVGLREGAAIASSH